MIGTDSQDGLTAFHFNADAEGLAGQYRKGEVTVPALELSATLRQLREIVRANKGGRYRG